MVLRLRVGKLDQRESLLVGRTDNPRVPAQTYEILGFTIGAATNMTGWGVVCGPNLF